MFRLYICSNSNKSFLYLNMYVVLDNITYNFFLNLQTLNDLVVPEVGLFVTSLINEALDYHRLPYSRAEMAISWITPRKSTLECLIAVAGISAESDSTNFPLGDNLYKYCKFIVFIIIFKMQ